jgi:hypothetical protein
MVGKSKIKPGRNIAKSRITKDTIQISIRIRSDLFKKLPLPGKEPNRAKFLNDMIENYFNKNLEKTSPAHRQLLLFLIKTFIEQDLEVDIPPELVDILLNLAKEVS